VIERVARQTETDRVGRISSRSRARRRRGRTLVQSLLADADDIAVTDSDLRVASRRSAHYRTEVLAALCAGLDALAPHFPGTLPRVRHTA
jgi:hypothetical protein